jgi:peptidoglycan/LPS O-acetylase OafA/YrhL
MEASPPEQVPHRAPEQLAAEVPRHLPEIDWLKGFAILCVVCVHAKIYDLGFVHIYVVNRAVPIFLVSLGITSELFFRKHENDPPRARLSSWYRSRFLRLLPPVWAMAAAWWAAVLYFHQADALQVGGREAVLTFLGYAPWIGTAWFITLVLQLVLIFPLLRWICVEAGAASVLPATALLCGYSVWWTWDLITFGMRHFQDPIPEPGWVYAWIFAPRVFFHVVAGIFVARYWRGRPNPMAALLAAALWAGATSIMVSRPPSPDDYVMGPIRHQIVAYLLDVPLAIALLGFFGLLTRFERAFPLRFLAFCGRASWGIYLGHLFVHEFIHLGRIAPETGPDWVRFIYAALLLFTGIGLAVAGDRLRKAARPRVAV